MQSPRILFGQSRSDVLSGSAWKLLRRMTLVARRTCARLCHGAGGELEQIQFLLGHASVQTTKRYIGCRQKFKDAVNGRFQISLAKTAW